MSDTNTREAARERLEQAELAEVLEVPIENLDEVGDGRAHGGGAWLSLLAAFLAVAITVVVSITRGDGTNEAQGPERWRPDLSGLSSNYMEIRSREDIAALPDYGGRARVQADVFDQDWLSELLRSPDLHHLSLRFVQERKGGGRGMWLGRQAKAEDYTSKRFPGFERVAAAPGLRSLTLLGVDLVPGELASLANAKDFRHLALMSVNATFDRELAQAVSRIPKLQTLALSALRLTEEGIATLARMESLRSLNLVSFYPAGKPLGAALAKLQQLDTLWMPSATNKLVGDAMFLTRMPNLQHLEVQRLALSDDVLAGLPQGLKTLKIGDWRMGGTPTTAPTPAGYRHLARLRALEEFAITFVPADYEATFDSIADALRGLPLRQIALSRPPTDSMWEMLMAVDTLRVLDLRMFGTPIGRSVDEEKLREVEARGVDVRRG